MNTTSPHAYCTEEIAKEFGLDKLPKSLVTIIPENKNKKFKVEIYEKAYYTLSVEASSEVEARKLVRGINKGHAIISDFQPDQNGGSCPSSYGNVVIQSIQEEVTA